MANSNYFHLSDVEEIESRLMTVSKDMVGYIKDHPESSYDLWYKLMTHSDLAGKGKRIGNEGVEKNYLYYLSVPEMENLERSGYTFPVAKQSDIVVPYIVFKNIGMPRKNGEKPSDYADVFFVSDSLKYFTEEYTVRILKELQKGCPWLGKGKYSKEGTFIKATDLEFHSQGLGAENKDSAFNSLRLSIFLNDTIFFLTEVKKDGSKSLYIMLEKNQKFFSLLGMENEDWNKYLDAWQTELDKLKNSDAEDKLVQTERMQRALQSRWKDVLAAEMKNYIMDGSKVFCPFTHIESDYSRTPMLFIASHIKRHSESGIHEKYDPNNGLLLVANADALFDKFMITVSPEKELVFSCLIDDDEKLKRDLLLNHEIFKQVLNPQRMHYMEWHRKEFEKRETQRRKEFQLGSKVNNDLESLNNSEIPDNDEQSSDSGCVVKETVEALNSNVQLPVVGISELGYPLRVPSGSSCILFTGYTIPALRWIRRNKKFYVPADLKSSGLLKSVDMAVLYSANDPDTYQVFETEARGMKNSKVAKTEGYPAELRAEVMEFYLGNDRSLECSMSKIIQIVSNKNSGYKKGDTFIIRK